MPRWVISGYMNVPRLNLHRWGKAILIKHAPAICALARDLLANIIKSNDLL